MSPKIRELILWERNRKRGIEDILYYISLFVTTSMAFIWGFSTEGNHWDIGMIPIYGYMHLLGICSHEEPLVRVKEKGKMRSIFYKYMYTPIDLTDLYKAKLYVISRDVIKISLIQQALAILARCIDGGDFSYMGHMLVPTYAGVILILGYAVSMWSSCCKCKRNI